MPEFRRGHGALYDALAAGRINEEALAALLAGTLPQLIDGDEGRAWAGEHDTIDHGLVEHALAACPPRTPRRSGRRARGGAGCGSRSTPPPIPARTPNAPRNAATSTTTPAAATAPARPSPAGIPVHRRARAPAHRECRPHRRRAHHPGRPDPADRPAGQEPAPAPARRRERRARRAAGHHGRRVQRRRADRRADPAAGAPAHPAGLRQRLLRRPRYLARQERPPRQARQYGHLSKQPRPGQPRTRRDPDAPGHPAVRHRPGQRLAECTP